MVKNSRYLVKTILRGSNLIKKLAQTINAIGGFEIIGNENAQQPDLLIFEMGENPQKDMEFIKTIINSGGSNEVFLVSESKDPDVLMQALRLGVKEFFVQPLNSEEVKQALERFRQRRIPPAVNLKQKNGQIISIFGSKGGVGTTTMAVNLAVSLLQNDHKNTVALLDMNTLFGEIPLFLEMSPKFHWGEITKNIERLDHAFLSNILTHHNSGVQILPSPAYLNGHIQPTPDIMSRLLGLMQQMFDYVIIDTGQSTNDTALKVLQISDILLLVTILSLPCLSNTNKLLQSFTDLGYVQRERIKVVLNRFIKKSDISLKDAENGIGKKLFWTIPNDFKTTMAAINNGKPLQQVAPKAAISKSFREMATLLSAPGKKKKKRWSFFSS
jgi:pilus assembly protein CpaE